MTEKKMKQATVSISVDRFFTQPTNTDHETG